MSKASMSYFVGRIQFSGEFSRAGFGVRVAAPAILHSPVDADVGNGFSIYQVSIGAFRGGPAFDFWSMTLGARQLSIQAPSSIGRRNAIGADDRDTQLAMPRIIEVRATVETPPSSTSIDVYGLSADNDGQVWFAFEDSFGNVIKWHSVYYAGSQIDLPGGLR